MNIYSTIYLIDIGVAILAAVISLLLSYKYEISTVFKENLKLIKFKAKKNKIGRVCYRKQSKN